MRSRGRRRRLASAILTALIVVLLVAGRDLLRNGIPVLSPPASPGVVTRVYDGDTIEVAGVGKVRIIGIDAMDSYNTERMRDQSERYGMSEKVVKHWAAQATEFAHEMLGGKAATLQYGPERTDRYERTLAYVQVAGENGADEDFGLVMVQKGLAVAYRSFRHPREAEYLDAEKKARAGRVGIWQDARRAP